MLKILSIVQKVNYKTPPTKTKTKKIIKCACEYIFLSMSIWANTEQMNWLDAYKIEKLEISADSFIFQDMTKKEVTRTIINGDKGVWKS